MDKNLERLRSIKSFPSLVKYLRDELDWPIDSDDVDDLSFDYKPDELGINPQTAVKIKEIKQLRPFVNNQPWGIFYISFEPKRLPIVALRRILRSLVINKRQSANQAQQASWQLNDLLFISSYGESEAREISFAHFSEDQMMGDLPTLKVLGWNAQNTVLRLEDTHDVLKEKLRWPDDESDVKTWRKLWSEAFKLQYRETIRTSKELAIRLAELATMIRARVNDVLAVESDRGELRKMYTAFQEALIHDLDEDDFADMYAQTIAYGLLSASISRESGALVADNLKDMVPNTNPFLKELMQTFLTVGGRKNKIDFDELGINEVVELLRRTQMDEVLRDFGAKNPQEDPVIHFYELFLKEYDPEKRMRRGVFYTPRPVVSFIVRSVDEILRTEFGLEDGLADTTTWGEMVKRHKGLKVPHGIREDESFIQILDPATGTGTFLVEVIDQIYATMRAKWSRHGHNEQEMYELWNDYVPRHLLPRLHGFELMMAPYAIAHMKIGLKLRETHYSFLSSERARIYLTNTLEEPKDFSGYLMQMAPALAHEGEEANKIKRSTKLTVIIGNPPYSGHSVNNEISWIVQKVYDYKKGVPGLQKPGQAKWLQDDYVKFLRYAEWVIAQSGTGVLGYITNHSFLDNPTFLGMRHHMLQTFSMIAVVDLHGNLKKRERSPDGSNDENVFDIQQGVAVSIMCRHISVPPAVTHSDVFGRRSAKYEILNQTRSVALLQHPIQPVSPFFLLVPQDTSLRREYDNYYPITKVMGEYGDPAPGVVTTQDEFAISFQRAEVLEKVKRLLETENEEQARTLFRLCGQSQWDYARAKRVLSSGNWKKKVGQIYYRPFDIRWTVYDENVAVHRRLRASSHFLGHQNLGLCIGKAGQVVGSGEWNLVCSTRHPVDFNLFYRGGACNLPMFLYSDLGDLAEGRRANLTFDFLDKFARALALSEDSAYPSLPEMIFHYAYAVFHSPGYRRRYQPFLRLDFPRLPVTSNLNLFNRLHSLGADLIALHLLEPHYPTASWNRSKAYSDRKKSNPLTTKFIELQGGGTEDIAKGYPKYHEGNIYINPNRYFGHVPEPVWSFHIGGYQVCKKWLKDRRGRTLSTDEINHYQRVLLALGETIRLMTEIDHVIEEYGGWPLVGSQESVNAEAATTLPFA